MLSRIYRAVIGLETVLAGTFLVAMVALIFLGGVARMLGQPLNWTIDLATCFFAWGCFLCADIAWRRNALMSIDIVSARLGETGRWWLQTLNLVLIAGFLVYIAGTGAWLSWVSRARSFQGLPGISYSWVTMSIVAGGILLLVTTFTKLSHHLRQAPRAPNPGEA